MNRTDTRRSAAALATATAAVLALGIVGPSPADAYRPTPDGGRPTTTACGTMVMDIGEVVAMLKSQRAQYLNDHPRLMR